MGKKSCYWAAPSLVAVIMLAVYLANGLFPFGTGTISWCDMNQQVIPFLMDFKDILTGKANMFLNLQNAGGMSFWGVFLFFISSPFSFLVVFIQKAQVYYFVNILLILKISTCSVTACLFFNRKFSQLNFLQTIALSLMYSFCGYAMFYFQNIVWLDIMYLFPLLLLGLDSLVTDRKVLLYILTFSAVLTVNFYLCYMVTIFVILAVGIYLFICVPKQVRPDRVFIFGLSSFTSVLITGVIWLPSLMQYLSSARTGDIISSLQSSSLLTRLNTTIPVILCTGAAVAGVVMTLVLQNYKERKITWIYSMMFLMLVPVIIEPINKMWHTGSYQSFPVRYGYIPAFLCLILCAAAIKKINLARFPYSGGILSNAAALLALTAVVFSAVSLLRWNYDDITAYTQTLWGSSKSFKLLLLFFLTAALTYLILFLLYYYRKLREFLFSALLCFLVIIESVFYSNVYIASAKNNAQYYSPIMDLSSKIQDSTFYRVKMNQKYFDVNLVGSMGYNSLSHYTSLTSKDYMYTMKKLGYSSYWMEVNSNGGTKLTDAILGNQYSIQKTDHLCSDDRKVYGNGLYSIIKNPISLPIGFVMKSGHIQNLEKLPDMTRLNLQEYLYQSVFQTSQSLFVRYQPTQMDNVTFTGKSPVQIVLNDDQYEGTLTYKIPVTGTQTLYFDCFDQISNRLYEHINSSFSITVNGSILQIEYPTQYENGLIKLGTFKDQTVTVEIGILRSVYARSFGIAGLRDDVLSSSVNRVSKAALKQSGNTITGTAAADGENEYLFLPINYDKAYTAVVNGKNVPIQRVFDTFMAIRLEKGMNTITVSYVPEGFWKGFILSILGVLCLFFLYGYIRQGRPIAPGAVKKISEALFVLIFVFTLAFIYLFPMIVYFNKK